MLLLLLLICLLNAMPAALRYHERLVAVPAAERIGIEGF